MCSLPIALVNLPSISFLLFTEVLIKPLSGRNFELAAFVPKVRLKIIVLNRKSQLWPSCRQIVRFSIPVGITKLVRLAFNPQYFTAKVKTNTLLPSAAKLLHYNLPRNVPKVLHDSYFLRYREVLYFELNCIGTQFIWIYC